MVQATPLKRFRVYVNCDRLTGITAAKPFTRDRRDHRNGFKPRPGGRLKTRIGEIEMDVPQVRGCNPYHPSMFTKYQQSERALLVACAEMYFQGVARQPRFIGVFISSVS